MMWRILWVILWGIVVHFVWVTIMQSLLGDMWLGRLWKEIALVWLAVVVMRGASYKIWSGTMGRRLAVGLGSLIVAVARSLRVSFGLYDVSVFSYMQAFKYDFFFIVPLVLGIVMSYRRGDGAERFLEWCRRGLLIVLVMGIVRYGMLAWFPEVIAMMGYDDDSWWWTAGAIPPVRYLTNVWRWYIRNQGIFSWPVSWWFLLVGVGPWLIASTKHKGRTYGAIVALWIANVVLSFSRAAWGVSVVAWVMLLVWMRMHQRSRVRGLVVWWVVWVLVAVWLVGLVGQRSIRAESDITTESDSSQESDAWVFQRELSDTGHHSMVMMAIDLVRSKLWTGRWAASAGPASFVDRGASVQTGLVLPEAHQWLHEQWFTSYGSLEEYRPDDLLSRQMLAIMLDRVVSQYALDVPKGEECEIPDMDLVEDVHHEAVRRVCQMGLLEVYDDGYFRPYKTTTYREALVALVGLVDGNVDDVVARAVQLQLYQWDDKDIRVTPTYRKHIAVWLWLLDRQWQGEQVTYPEADFAGAITGFNPENNYLQIAIEYGVVWLMWWLMMCVSVLVLGVLAWQRSGYRDGNVYGLLVWLCGLAAAAMVLHPFVDSQVMYVLMILLGVVIGEKMRD